MEELTPEERERNRQKWQETKLKRWNESLCVTCPLLTERAKRGYLQLGAFRCDDPMGEVHMVTRFYPADNRNDCDIVNNIHKLYNVSKPKLDKLLQLIEENPTLLDITKGE